MADVVCAKVMQACEVTNRVVAASLTQAAWWLLLCGFPDTLHVALPAA
jgi:hypothetical protein